MLPLIKKPGRIPKHPFREVVDAILYLDWTGCSWRQLPVDYPYQRKHPKEAPLGLRRVLPSLTGRSLS